MPLVMDQQTIRRLEAKLEYAEQQLQRKNEIISEQADEIARLYFRIQAEKDGIRVHPTKPSARAMELARHRFRLT